MITIAEKGDKLITSSGNIIGLDNSLQADANLFSEKQIDIKDNTCFDMPGEYEVKGIHIKAFSSNEKNIYKIVDSGMRILYIGNEVEFNNQIASDIGDIDVMITKTDNKLKLLLEEIEPKLLVLCGNFINTSKEKISTDIGVKIEQGITELKIKDIKIQETIQVMYLN